MNRFALLLLLILLAAPARAEDLIYKPAVDYTLDDGIMDEKEMREEADYVFRLCSQNLYQKMYFDCRCVSGAFLMEREKAGPMKPQPVILQDIMQNGAGNCASTEQIAGNAFETCINHMNTFRELEPGKEEYCTCVANRMANSFSKSPRLDIGLIEDTRMKSMAWCDNPQNRVRKTAAP